MVTGALSGDKARWGNTVAYSTQILALGVAKRLLFTGAIAGDLRQWHNDRIQT